MLEVGECQGLMSDRLVGFDPFSWVEQHDLVWRARLGARPLLAVAEDLSGLDGRDFGLPGLR